MHAVVPAILVLALMSCNLRAAAQPAGGSQPSRPSAADVAYCGQLASLYERYGSSQDMRGEEFDVGVSEAINQCHSGDTAGGIATLERRLKDQKISLPPR
jgi:hypothetical protein